MDIHRRHLIGAAGVAGALATAPDVARAAPLTSTLGRDVTHYGVRPGSPDDQTKALQRAIDDAARAQVPLALPPGVYRTGMLRLQNGTQLVGVRGATNLVFTGGVSMLSGEGAGSIGLTGLTLDGGGMALPARHGLVHCLGGRDIRIADCEISGSGGNGIWFENVSGDVSGNIIGNTASTAIVSFDALGLLVSRNTIAGTNDNGIEILRTAIGDDGTLVLDNRIEDIKAGPGGSGQYGNAINAFRAGNVIVRGNRIRNCDYSAVRGNSASNIQITGNSVSDVREVALYSEFAFEGAVIANNTVDGAALGVSVCNFNEGGRLAVVQGNIIRNLLPKRPIGTAPDDDAGVGIYVEADSSVTGNVIENAPSFGIIAGWGKYLRDVVISGNVIRNALVGIGVSVAPGAGTVLVNNNMISETPRGAVVGLDHARPVTADLSAEGAQRFAQVVIGTNAVRR
ncbi:MAG TPA: TIGR03808 family TAT-translocated repetitive protein [Xanthobacteraceae bacterium]